MRWLFFSLALSVVGLEVLLVLVGETGLGDVAGVVAAAFVYFGFLAAGAGSHDNNIN